MELVFISGLSVLIQFVTVVMALRLIRVSGGRAAWILISSGIFLMALRRGITLYRLISGEPPHRLDLPYELIGLLISLFMLAGIVFIGPIFRSIRSNEEALRKSEAQFREILETTHEGVWRIDMEGKTLFVNPRMAEMLGTTQEDMRGRSFLDFVEKDERNVILGQLDLRRQGIASQYEFRFRRKDGSDLWAIVATNPVFDGGKVVGALGMVTDIGDRKGMEKEREELIRNLTDALANVRTLRGFLPICASCKKIRDDKGYWNQIESYIREHTGTEFSHGICPECRDRLYGGIVPG